MTPPTEQPKGIIFQQGYRHYEGRYLGRLQAIASLAWSDLRRALGIKRSWKYKAGLFTLIGIILIITLIAFFTNIVTERVTVGSESRSFNPFANPYNGLFDSINGIIFWLLCALIIPDLLCNDRRYGVLPLYLARPISLGDYLAGKGLAIIAVLLAALWVPELLLFLAKALSAAEPTAYASAHLGDLGALLATGLIFAVYYALLSGALSSLTKSTGYAAGGIVGLLVAAQLIGGTIFLFAKRRPVTLIELGDLVGRVKDALFGVERPLFALNFNLQNEAQPVDLATLQPYPVWVYAAAVLAVALLSALIILWRYRREAT